MLKTINDPVTGSKKKPNNAVDLMNTGHRFKILKKAIMMVTRMIILMRMITKMMFTVRTATTIMVTEATTGNQKLGTKMTTRKKYS